MRSSSSSVPEALHEGLVDLHEGQRQAAQVGERRVAGAEVVEADLHAEVRDALELVEDVGVQVHDRRLGELEVQAARRPARCARASAARPPAGRRARTGARRG